MTLGQEGDPLSVAPGWYPDPTDPTQWRWWDGERWTEHTSGGADRSVTSERLSEAPASAHTASEVEPTPKPASSTGSRSRWWLGAGLALVVLATAAFLGFLLLGGDSADETIVSVGSSPSTTPNEDQTERDETDEPERSPATSAPSDVVSPSASPSPNAGTPPTPFWTAILESLETDRYTRDDAEDRAQEYRQQGIGDVDVLDSTDFASLNPGYWAVYSGTFSSQEEAADHCAEIRDQVEFCYDRLVDQETDRGTGTDAAALNAAQNEIRNRGYEPVDTRGFSTDETLQVITGSQAGSATGRPMFAFFFVNGEIIGTDTAEPSASVSYGGRVDSGTVRITYGTYEPEDPMCCPSSTLDVRYRWNGDNLEPLDPIPTNDPDASGSRR